MKSYVDNIEEMLESNEEMAECIRKFDEALSMKCSYIALEELEKNNKVPKPNSRDVEDK